MAMSDGKVVIDVLVNEQSARSEIERIDQLLNNLGNNAGNGLDESMNETLQDLRRQLDQLGGDIGDNLNDGFNQGEQGAERLEKSFGKIKLAAAGIFAGVAVAVVDMAKDFDESVTKIQNSFNITRDEAEKLGDTAVNAWKMGFGENVGEVSDALIQVKQNMKDIGDGADLENATKKAMGLAQTFDADVNEVTRAGNNIMKSFGIDSDKAFDLMAQGAAKGLNMSNEMFDNLAEYTPLWGQMGYSAEDMFNTLVNASEAGVYNLDYVNDAMKEFQIRMKDGSKGTAEAMAELPKSTQEMFEKFQQGDATVQQMNDSVLGALEGMDDQTKANQLGVALYGTKWEDLESKAMYALQSGKDAMKGYEGAADNVVENLQKSFDFRLKSVTRTAQAALKPLAAAFLGLAEIVLPPIQKAVEAISVAIEDFVGFLKDNSDTIKEIFGAIGDIIKTVLTGALEFIEPVIDKVKEMYKAFKASGGAENALEKVSDALRSLAEHKEQLKIIGEILLSIFVAKAIYSGTVALAAGVRSGVAAFRAARTAIIAYRATLVGMTAAQKAAAIAQRALNLVMRANPIGLVVTAIAALVAGFVILYKHNEKFRNFMDSVWDAVKGAAKGIKKAWGNMIEWFGDTFRSIKKWAGKVGGYFEDMKDKAVKQVKRLANGVADRFSDLKEDVMRIVKWVLNFVVDYFEFMYVRPIKFIIKLVKAVYNHFDDMRDKAVKIVKNMLNKVLDYFGDMVRGGVREAKELYDKVSSWFDKARDKVKGIAENMAKAVKNAFDNMRDWTVNIVKDMYNKVSDWFEKIFKKAKELPKDMAKGIEAGKEKVKSAATAVGNKAREGVNKLIGGVESGVNFILGAVGADDIKIKTIPKFASGTGGHMGGLMMVNDAPTGDYKEMVKLPNGKAFIPEGRNVILDAPAGTQVMRGDHTKKFMESLNIPKYANGTGWLASAKDFVGGIIGKADKLFDNIDDFIKNPVKFIAGVVYDKMEKILSKTGAKGVVKDMGISLPKFVGEKAKDWIKGLLEGGGGGGDFGGYAPYNGDFNKISNDKGVYDYLYDLGKQIVRKFKSKYSGLYISSGKRSTSANTGGVKSDHTTGLALDLARGGVRDNSYYQMAKTLVNHPYLKFVIGSNKWAKNGGSFSKYPYAAQADHSNHLHISAKNPKDAKAANGSGGGKVGGSAKAWTADIKRAYKQIYGTNISARGLAEVLEQIQTESGGNAKISQGIIDVNSHNGTGGAKGLLQFIQPTFDNYKLKGYGDIWNGYHQLLALFNVRDWFNAITRAGKGKGWSPRSGRVKGYASGTNNAERGLYSVNENGGEMMFFNGGEVVVPHDLSKKALSMAFKDMSANNTLVQQAAAIVKTIGRQKQAQQLNNGINKYMVDEIINAIRANGGNNDVIINLDGREFVRVVNAHQARDMQQINYFGG